MKSYKKLVMWQRANELVLLVYKVTKEFPREEKYGITSQLRRAAVSVVLNIIEGYGRRSRGEFRRFLDISLGSLTEVEYLLELAFELGFINRSTLQNLENIRSECGKLIWSYRKKLG